MSDLLIFAANSSSSPLDREAWSKAATDDPSWLRRLAVCQDFQLEIVRHENPLRLRSLPSQHYSIRVKDTETVGDGRVLSRSWLAPVFNPPARSIWFAYSSYDLHAALAKLQKATFVPDALKKAANESPQVRAEIKKSVMDPLGETNLVQIKVQKRLGETEEPGGYTISCDVTPMTVGFPPWGADGKLEGETEAEARQSLSKYWKLPPERVRMTNLVGRPGSSPRYLDAEEESEVRISFSDATEFVEFLRDYSGPVTGAVSDQAKFEWDCVIIDSESEIMYTVTPRSQRAAVLRLVQKAVVKIGLGESEAERDFAERFFYQTQQQRRKVKQATTLALGGLPGSLAKFVMDGTLELSTTRPDGTLEFSIESASGHETPGDSKLVWHPEGAAQDYENLQFYVETARYRRGDWSDPRHHVEYDIDTLEDLVWFLEEIHRI